MPDHSRTAASTSAMSSSIAGGQRATARSSSRSAGGGGPPRAMYGAHLGRQHVLPARMHDALDPELERDLRRVPHVLGVAEDHLPRRRIVDEDRLAGHVELVAPWLGLGEGLERVPPV